MKRFLVSLTVAMALSAGWMAFGHAQEPQNPFHQRNTRGEIVHVLPPAAAIREPGDRMPIDAPPSDESSVYPASYGSGNLMDHGGAEISNAGFMAVYWNNDVAGAAANSGTIRTYIDSFVSAFSDGLNWTDRATADFAIIQQYGSHDWISPQLGNFGSYLDTSVAQSSINDSDIPGYLVGLFGSNLQSNVIYGVYFPPNMTVKLSPSSVSCSSFCGYHSHFTYGSKLIRYAAFPYLNCSACRLSGKSVADMLTVVTSHEIREAVTDPSDNGQYAWFDRAGYEADDKCAWHNLYPMNNGGFLVQPEYSNGGNVTRSGFTATYPGPGCIVPSNGSSGGGGNGHGHGRGGH